MTISEQARESRRLVRSVESGVLSTMSLELPGYPFGSIVPYITLPTGELVFYVSSIAQHTKNMRADPKVSLTVLEGGGGNVQARARVTLIGDARQVPDERVESVCERYLRYFPAAGEYAGTHDFSFFWIQPLRVRSIGGFGKIFWVEGADWRLPEPDWLAAEPGMLEHMNADHPEALRAHVPPGTTAALRLVGLDPEGTHVSAGGRIHYVPFAKAAFETAAVRRELVHLARS